MLNYSKIRRHNFLKLKSLVLMGVSVEEIARILNISIPNALESTTIIQEAHKRGEDISFEDYVSKKRSHYSHKKKESKDEEPVLITPTGPVRIITSDQPTDLARIATALERIVDFLERRTGTTTNEQLFGDLI